jgi:hypothetical protein
MSTYSEKKFIKLKNEFSKIEQAYTKIQELVNREKNSNKKEQLTLRGQYMFNKIIKLNKKSRSLQEKIKAQKKSKNENVTTQASKERVAFKRKANNAFNTPKKGPTPNKNKPIISPIKFDKNMENLQRGLFLTPNRSKSSNKK